MISHFPAFCDIMRKAELVPFLALLIISNLFSNHIFCSYYNDLNPMKACISYSGHLSLVNLLNSFMFKLRQCEVNLKASF